MPGSLQISKYEDPQEAAIAVVVEAYRLWLQYEVRPDDITIIIARVEGLKETSAINKKQSMKCVPMPFLVCVNNGHGCQKSALEGLACWPVDLLLFDAPVTSSRAISSEQGRP